MNNPTNNFENDFNVVTPQAPCCGPDPATLAASQVVEILPDKDEKPTPIKTGATITGRDRFTAFKARWGIDRMSYVITPGLYALGSPTENSEVLVTANYKLSFDHLRKELGGRDAWILVLNTYGINVWCAAGKGTFGTDELVRKITDYNLDKVVRHKRIIVPQLGAPGVSGYKVKERTGFNVRFGPVLAADLPGFLDSGRKATSEMRRKRFPILERFVLIPVELNMAFKWILGIAAAFFFAGGLGAEGGYVQGLLSSGLFAVTSLFAALVAGVILTPLLLPVLPGRSFSIKSVPLSLGLVVGTVAVFAPNLSLWSVRMEIFAWALMAVAMGAFLAMNFTGASTYTSLSGVKKEMRVAVPIQIGLASLGLVTWIAARFVA